MRAATSTAGRSGRRAALRRVALALLALPPLVLALTAASIAYYPARLTVERADAAVVLGSAIWGDRPSPIFQARIDHGLDLYRAGRVRKLIFTGGQPPDEPWTESAVARDYAIEKGVPAEDILIEAHSHTTFQNLYYMHPIAERAGLRTFIIVSDQLHLRRAMMMAKGLAATPSATPYTRLRGTRVRARFIVRETFLYLGFRVARLFPTVFGPEDL